MSSDLTWYALYTRPLWEKKVTRLLELKEIENYCPLQKVQRKWSDRIKVITEPLFKCYVFVHVNAQSALHALQTDGVINYVSWEKKRAAIRDIEIEMIKNFLVENEQVYVEKLEYNIQDPVRIISGPFHKQTGTILHVKSKTVKLLLPSLGFAMVAEIEKTKIERFVHLIKGSDSKISQN